LKKPTMNSNRALDSRDPEVLSVLVDHDAMQTWECLRQLGGRVSLATLSAAMGRGVEPVGRSLDRLESIGLVEKQRAQRDQRVPTFEVTCERFSVMGSPDDAETRTTLAHLAEATRSLHATLVTKTKPMQEMDANDVVFGEAHALILDDDDLHELQARLASVAEFLESHGKRMRKARHGVIERCNYMVSVHMAPLAEPVLPSPVVSLSADGSDHLPSPAQPHESMLLPVNLSERELEVARELHDGQTRNEIAGKLGLSPHTVHAHCKRIFRKLGIGRAAELRRFALHPLTQHHAQNRVGR
jgi:DNA-binding NarL/FixJ family response regulator